MRNTEVHKMLDETLFTVNEAAQNYRLSPWTIWALLKQGRLVRTKIAGKTFIRESEMQKLVRDVKAEPKNKSQQVEAKAVRSRVTAGMA
jgi:hypothetical protein